MTSSPAESNKLSPPPRVLVAFACVYLFWGSTYFAMRTGVEAVPPLVLASVRFLIAGPLMLGLCRLRGLTLWQSRRDFLWLAVIATLMLGLGNTGIVFAEQYLDSGFASLLAAVIPIYVALLELALPGGEGLRARGWAGIGIGFMGLVALLLPGLREGRHGHSGHLIGSVVALVSTFGWSCASVLSRRAKLKAGTFVAAAWEMCFAGVLDFALLLATGGSLRHVHWTAAAWQSIAWLVMFGSLVGYSAYIYLLDHVPVAKVSTYAYINPIVAVLLGALFLHERMQRVEFAGMALILVAVYLVTSSKLQKKVENAIGEASESAVASSVACKN